jgi:hypothetical protein
MKSNVIFTDEENDKSNDSIEVVKKTKPKKESKGKKLTKK